MPRGRPHGALSEKTLTIQRFCRLVCEDEQYRASIFERARTNNLGSMEPVIWAYAYGKPKQAVDLRLGRIGDSDEALEDAPLERLQERAQELMVQVREAAELEQELLALPAVQEVQPVEETTPCPDEQSQSTT